MPIFDGLEKILPVERIYSDLASPAAKEIGDVALNTIKAARFIVAPIDYLASQQDRWQKFLKRVSDQVPEENLIPANPQIAGVSLDNLKHMDELSILSELFINLLARSIDRERVNEAHPAFPTIISQLSPDEAIILFELSKKPYKLEQQCDYDKKIARFYSRKDALQEFPCEKLMYPQHYHLYMSHLYSLNLAGIWEIESQVPIYKDGAQVGVRVISQARLTSFGELFSKACMPKDIESFIKSNFSTHSPI